VHSINAPVREILRRGLRFLFKYASQVKAWQVALPRMPSLRAWSDASILPVSISRIVLAYDRGSGALTASDGLAGMRP
jgi:hypothetical protein